MCSHYKCGDGGGKMKSTVESSHRYIVVPLHGSRITNYEGKKTMLASAPWPCYESACCAQLSIAKHRAMPSLNRHEKTGSDHQAIQARRGQRGAGRTWYRRDDRHGSKGIRPAKRPHRDLSRQRIYGRFPAKSESGSRARRRYGRESRERGGGCG